MQEKLRYAAMAMVVSYQTTLQGCASSPSSQECEAISDPGPRVQCLDHVLYQNLGMSVGLGAAAGAVLGGAIGFATTRSVRGIVGTTVAGGMAGGVAAGLAAYLQDLRGRTAGDMARQAAKNSADLEAYTRKNGILVDSLVNLLKIKEGDKESLELAKTELLRAKQVYEVHLRTAEIVGRDPETDDTLQSLREEMKKLRSEIESRDTLAQAAPMPYLKN